MGHVLDLPGMTVCSHTWEKTSLIAINVHRLTPSGLSSELCPDGRVRLPLYGHGKMGLPVIKDGRSDYP